MNNIKETIWDCVKINLLNGGTIGVITLTDVKEVMAILLTAVSIVATLKILVDNWRKKGEK
jgi:hypothetical protein